MAQRKFRKLACLAKIETVEGTDAVPTGALNAIQLNDVTFTPKAGDQEQLNRLLPYLGNQGIILTGNYVQLEFGVEVAGAGAAGDVPGYGVLLRACAMSETISAGASVTYEPVSDGEESASLYYNQDGVLHVLLGARGTFTMEFTPKQVPRFRFSIMGLEGTVTDTALPVVDLTGYQTPLAVSKAHTSFSLHGAERIAERVSFNLGNTVSPRHLIGDERIQLEDRQTSGEAVVEAKTLATVNWFAIAEARTRAAAQLVHGTTAGNIVQIDAPKVEIGRPAQGQTQGVVNYTLPLILCPDAGNDEISITVK